jgi:flagellar biosynthesis/type III secretory pathway M-ring protein FliF/YscJ
VDGLIWSFGIGAKGCLYRTNKLGGNMEKLKTMWKDLSKKAKFALIVVVIIAVAVAYNAIV